MLKILLRIILGLSNANEYVEVKENRKILVRESKLKDLAGRITTFSDPSLHGPAKRAMNSLVIESLKKKGKFGLAEIHGEWSGLELEIPEDLYESFRAIYDEDQSLKHLLEEDLPELSRINIFRWFVESVVEYKNGEALKYTRRYNNNLFVHEKFWPDIVTNFKNHLTRTKVFLPDYAEQAAERLRIYFKEGRHYLKNRNFCWKGRVINLREEFEGLQEVETLQKATLLTYEDNISWNDPEIASIPGLYVRWEEDKQDHVGYVKVDGEEYILTPHAVFRFFQRGKKRFEKFNPRDKKKSIKKLVSLISRSREVSRGNSLKQLLKYNFKRAMYRTHSGWIMVFEEDTNALKTCYYKGDVESHGYEYVEA